MQVHECEFDAQEFKAEHDDDGSTAWAIYTETYMAVCGKISTYV